MTSTVWQISSFTANLHLLLEHTHPHTHARTTGRRLPPGSSSGPNAEANIQVNHIFKHTHRHSGETFFFREWLLSPPIHSIPISQRRLQDIRTAMAGLLLIPSLISLLFPTASARLVRWRATSFNPNETCRSNENKWLF